MEVGMEVTDKKIIELLNEMATLMPSEQDTSNWCYLPYWFNVHKGKVVAYHINQLPKPLTFQLKRHRGILNKNLKKVYERQNIKKVKKSIIRPLV